ncbi:MAG: ABC transporter permease [Candidatus Omnitrophica bacterium]|nr:ABC transporter permease [Candidatus Omnitrophota bacterium]
MNFRARIEKLFSYKAVLWEMSLKHLKSKYSGSMLGLWWAVIIPLILAFSINFIFVQVFKVQAKNYAFFILSGMIPWAFFSNTLSEAAGAFFAHSSILKQSSFPREFVVISVVLANFLNFCIGLLFLLPLFIFFNLKVFLLLPALLCAILLYLLFVAGLSLLCSVANVFLRDMAHFLSIGLMIWFWVTPVFYSSGMLDPFYRWVLFLNPMTYFVVFYQDILFAAKMSSGWTFFACVGISVIFFMGGYVCFLKLEPKILKKI